MEQERNENQDLYFASRPDCVETEARYFLTDRLTWTKNRSLARTGSLSSMEGIIRKILHAYPELILEKDDGPPING